MTEINIYQFDHAKDLPLPEHATTGSAGADLIAAIDSPILLSPHKRVLVSTGIAISLPCGYEAQIRPRSGLALKHGITVLNTPGTIDSDYRGEIKVILINLGDETFVIERGMRVAQMVIAKYEKAEFCLCSHPLDETQRSSGGFGSTGFASAAVSRS